MGPWRDSSPLRGEPSTKASEESPAARTIGRVARVAIIGAGNLGSFLAAHLLQNGHDVFFCVRRPMPSVRVDGVGAATVPCYMDKPPAADIVLLTVKAHDTPAARRWLRYFDAPVAVIQNGVHHAERVAPHPAIPVLSYVYIEARDGIHYPYAPPMEHFTVPAEAASQPFVRLFPNSPIRIRLEETFAEAAWRKMLHNCVSNPLTCIAGRGLEILREPLYQEWAWRILDEAVPVAQADGANIGKEDAERAMAILASYPPGTRTSMLQDRERGKTLEIGALNGAIVELGRRYGLPTPVNEDLVAKLVQSSET